MVSVTCNPVTDRHNPQWVYEKLLVGCCQAPLPGQGATSGLTQWLVDGTRRLAPARGPLHGAYRATPSSLWTPDPQILPLCPPPPPTLPFLMCKSFTGSRCLQIMMQIPLTRLHHLASPPGRWGSVLSPTGAPCSSTGVCTLRLIASVPDGRCCHSPSDTGSSLRTRLTLQAPPSCNLQPFH